MNLDLNSVNDTYLNLVLDIYINLSICNSANIFHSYSNFLNHQNPPWIRPTNLFKKTLLCTDLLIAVIRY
jgi:uncharacterized Fe-S cluster protein YjdI